MLSMVNSDVPQEHLYYVVVNDRGYYVMKTSDDMRWWFLNNVGFGIVITFIKCPISRFELIELDM